jgi:hypothetical protein
MLRIESQMCDISAGGERASELDRVLALEALPGCRGVWGGSVQDRQVVPTKAKKLGVCFELTGRIDEANGGSPPRVASLPAGRRSPRRPAPAFSTALTSRSCRSRRRNARAARALIEMGETELVRRAVVSRDTIADFEIGNLTPRRTASMRSVLRLRPL